MGMVQTGHHLVWRGGGAAADAIVDGTDLRPGMDVSGLGEAVEVRPLFGTYTRGLARFEPSLRSDSAWHRSDSALGPVLVIEGFPTLDRVGAGMSEGVLIVRGDVGRELAAGMTGGEVFVSGDAGDFAGVSMRRGLVVVAGMCGRSPGYRMRAGTLIVGRGSVDWPGLEMRRGTILCMDHQHPLDADGKEHLSIDGRFATPSALRVVLRRAATLDDSAGWLADAVDGEFDAYSADRFGLNKGEVWQWVKS